MNFHPSSGKDPSSSFILRQLYDRASCTYTYLLGDAESRDAVLIDPVFEHAERDYKLVEELGLTLKFILNTHIHADHITASGLLKTRCSRSQYSCLKSIISTASKADGDIKVDHGDTVKIGRYSLTFRCTPGHTPGCICCVFDAGKIVFTGDSLLIKSCGRTDLEGGCPKTLYNSIHQQIFTLPDDYVVYPAHDYAGRTCSTIGEEKRFNPKINEKTNEKEFIQCMEEFGRKHVPPKMLKTAVSANRVCGLWNLPPEFEIEMQMHRKN